VPRDPFIYFGPNYIFGIHEDRHFKLCELTHTEEYKCMRDRLQPKGMCSGPQGHVTSINLGKYLRNGARRHIVAIED